MLRLVGINLSCIDNRQDVSHWYGFYGIFKSPFLIASDRCIKLNESFSFSFNSNNNEFDIYFNMSNCAYVHVNHNSKDDEFTTTSTISVSKHKMNDVANVYFGGSNNGVITSGVNVTIYSGSDCQNLESNSKNDFLTHIIFPTNIVFVQDRLSFHNDKDIRNVFSDKYTSYYCCSMSNVLLNTQNNVKIKNKFVEQSMYDDYKRMIGDIAKFYRYGNNNNDDDDVFLIVFQNYIDVMEDENDIYFDWRGYIARSSVVFDKQCLPVWSFQDLRKDSRHIVYDKSILFDVNHCNHQHLTSDEICLHLLTGEKFIEEDDEHSEYYDDNYFNSSVIRYPMYFSQKTNMSSIKWINTYQADLPPTPYVYVHWAVLQWFLMEGSVLACCGICFMFARKLESLSVDSHVKLMSKD